MSTIAVRLLPLLDEFTVYIYGVSFVSLLSLSPEFRGFFFGTGSISHVMFGIIYLVIGLLLLAIQVVGNFPKSPFERNLLLFYTITSCYWVGAFVLFADASLFHFGGDTIYLPIFYNYLYATYLVVHLTVDESGSDIVSDDQIPKNHAIVVSTLIFITFLYCSLFTQMPAAFIYQWCIFAGLMGKNMVEFLYPAE